MRLSTLGAMLLAGCVGTASMDGGSGGAGGGGGTAGTGGGTGGGAGGCLAATFLASLNRTRILAGGAFDDAQAAAAWDVRYQYISGGLADGAGPCASCASNCTAGGASCANAGPGCAWWGCWQYDQDPPGNFARGLVTKAKARAQLPMFTWYMLLQASGLQEGTGEVAALDDQAFLARYFADWRFLLRQVGNDVALLHVEPDFWGYAQRLSTNPHATPAKVKAANPADCAALEDSVAGFGRCMIAMARKYAPNAKVSLHASGWASGMDVLTNSNASLDVVGEANKVADFLAECGGAEADFVTVDASDRDSGYYQVVRRENRWWDATNATLPSFHQAFAWGRALAQRLGKPVVWWQLPVGNARGNDTANHYRDNRVDYFFAHTAELAGSHVAGFFFGPGAGDQTSAATDDGNLVAKLDAYRAGGGQPPCP